MNSKHIRSSQSLRGFTLVEVLVVIAIIGTLTSIITISYSEARKIARDNERITNLEQVRLALRLYYEANGRYPDPGCGNGTTQWAGDVAVSHPTIVSCSEYISGLVPNLLPALPKESDNNGRGYIYRIDASGRGTDYKLMAWRSVESLVVDSFDHPYARCSSPLGIGACPSGMLSNVLEFNNTYTVYTSGAETW